jgi:hypothetical protein
VGSEEREPPSGEGTPNDPGDTLRHRVAEARASIFESLSEVVARFEEEEARARVEAQEGIEAMVAERIADARAALERGIDERLDAATGEAAAKVDSEAERLAAESAQTREALEAEFERMALEGRSGPSERRVHDRIEQGMERVEGALGQIRESERRIVEAQDRAREIVIRIAAVARTAQEATDVEARIRIATAAEEEAARRILEAEERLRDQLD